MSSGKTDEVKGRIKEAAGVLTGNDKLRGGRQDRPGGRQGQASRGESHRQSRASREKSVRVNVQQHFYRAHPMAKKLKQPADKQQPQVPTQREAAVEQDRQAVKQQECDNPTEVLKRALRSDHSQDADRHNKTRHVQSEK